MNSHAYSDIFASKPTAKPSLHRQILESFIDGAELSVISALQKHRTIELRKIVSDLRRAGVPIADKWQKTPSGKHYKIYYLNQN
jgi:hypothetical protein